MTKHIFFFLYSPAIFLFSWNARAQAAPTASRSLQLSAFALLGDTYTGLSTPVTNTGGRNFTVTLGLNVDVYRSERFTLSAEARGAYPANQGEVDGERSLLAGARGQYRFVGPSLSRLRPYADVLAGRGEIKYVNGGFPTERGLYLQSFGAVYAAGGGLEYDVTRRFSIRGDVQFQRWNTPVIASGSLLSIQGSAGVGFALRFGGAAPR